MDILMVTFQGESIGTGDIDVFFNIKQFVLPSRVRDTGDDADGNSSEAKDTSSLIWET